MTEEFNNGVVAAENATEEMTENTTMFEQEQELAIPAAAEQAYAPEIAVPQEQACEPNPDTTEPAENTGVDPKVIAAGVVGTIAVLGATAAVAKKAAPVIKEKTAGIKAKIEAKWAEHKEKKAQRLDEKANRLRGITPEPKADNKKNEKK